MARIYSFEILDSYLATIQFPQPGPSGVGEQGADAVMIRGRHQRGFTELPFPLAGLRGQNVHIGLTLIVLSMKFRYEKQKLTK